MTRQFATLNASTASALSVIPAFATIFGPETTVMRPFARIVVIITIIKAFALHLMNVSAFMVSRTVSAHKQLLFRDAFMVNLTRMSMMLVFVQMICIQDGFVMSLIA